MSTIKQGDLVCVVRHPCCGAYVGLIYRVEEIQPNDGKLVSCALCGGRHPDEPLALREGAIEGKLCRAPLSWLKKIPPLSEPSHTERREEIASDA
jgi:hypothetical protein